MFLATTALVIVSLFVGGPFAALVLLALGGALASILVALWPNLDGRARTTRILLLAGLGLLAVLQMTR